MILEEIAMHEDDPADVVHDLFARGHARRHPARPPVLGTVDSIKRCRDATVWLTTGGTTGPTNLVVAAAGNVDHAAVVRLVRQAFEPLLGRGER